MTTAAMFGVCMTKQSANSVQANRARVYKKIEAIFDDLDSTFPASEVERLCGFKKSPFHRMLVASVLFGSFHCSNVTGVWKKPTGAKPL